MCFWSPGLQLPGSAVGEAGYYEWITLCRWDPCRMLCLAWLPMDWALLHRVDLSPGWHFDLVTLPSPAGREKFLKGIWQECGGRDWLAVGCVSGSGEGRPRSRCPSLILLQPRFPHWQETHGTKKTCSLGIHCPLLDFNLITWEL